MDNGPRLRIISEMLVNHRFGQAIFRLRRLFVVLVLWLIVLSPKLEADSVPVLAEDTMIKTGARKVMLHKGTRLSVLKQGNEDCIVALTLPDQTRLITQVHFSAIMFSGQARGKESELLPDHKRQPILIENHPAPVAIRKSKDDITSPDNTPDIPTYPQFRLPSASSDVSLPDLGYTVRTGIFHLPINNSVGSVIYALPMDKGRVAKSASNLVFYGPYPDEKTTLTANILPDLVKKLGCTVFSFQIKGLGQSVSEKPYYFSEAGWFDLAMEAREIIIERLALERKKLILVGYSGGAGMVMNFAGAYPDQIEAVAAQAPNVVPPFPHGNKIKWLLVVNRGDTNRTVMKPFYEQLREEHCQALYCETTPDRNRGQYHSPSGETFDLIYSFIAGILDQRRLASEDIQDLARQWPYVAPTSPLDRYAVVKTADLEPEDVKNGRFDLLPSLAFTVKWSQVCPPEQAIVGGDGRTRLIINFPARPVPAGVILYYDNPSYVDVPREIEDVNSLAEHGFLVVSTMTANPDEFVSASSAWVKTQSKLRGLHIHLVGNGIAGARFITKVAKRNDISFRSLSIIDFDNSWSGVEDSISVASAAKECGIYGFYSYSDSKKKSHLEEWASELVDRGAVHRGCFNVCSKPDAALHLTEPTRHTQAEDEALALIKSLIARADAR